MRRLSEDLAHRLAAEHALGTLRGRARARFEAIARADPSVEAIRRRWEAALAPLAQRVPEVEPPARVWSRIEERIARPAPASAWSSLGFWRGFGLLAGGVTSVLLATFLYISIATVPHGDPTFVAVLTSSNNEARMVLSMQAPDTLKIHNVKPWKTVEDAGRSLELWAMPKEGAARSLGLVANKSGDFVLRIHADDPRVQGVNTFSLTSELAGGSPTKQPTGPVLCAGAFAPVRKT
jgi:anti-sigma-K factor RskA